ncbi:MAG: NAD-glutamate dehydrogenase [Acidobacteriota bacterium]|nr:MAG: NAD-glutamate dehydrogenase [Acidobacteriota bacterium]
MTVTLKRLQGHIEQSSDDSVLGLYENLATVIYDSATAEFLQSFDVEALAAIVRNAVEFMSSRGGKSTAVRLYNPTVEQDGWSTAMTVLEIDLDDRPFIVDSIRTVLRREGLELHHLIHPILNVERGDDGRLKQIFMGHSAGARAEAYELFFVNRIDDARRLAELEADVRAVLHDVVSATDDYEDIREKCRQTGEWLETLKDRVGTPSFPESASQLQEYRDFIDWLDDGNFVFLGYREYEIGDFEGCRSAAVVGGSGLGILRDCSESSFSRPVPVSTLSSDLRSRMVGPPQLIITKTNTEATVHRAGRMDYIGVKAFDESGNLVGERRILGHFSTRAYSLGADRIPILRRKLRKILELARAKVGSHDFKEIVNILNSIPLPELFWVSTEELYQDIRKIMSVEQERGVRLVRRIDPFQRGVGVMVIMPRDRFNSTVRQRVQKFLADQLEATHVDYQLALTGDDQTQVRFHFFFSTALDVEPIDFKELEQEVIEMTRTWDDQLLELMVSRYGPDAAELAARYCRVFSDGYKAEIPAKNAVKDIGNLEALKDSPFRVDLINPERTSFPFKTTHLRVYHPGTIALAEIFPILENLGLKIFEQISYQLADPSGTKGRRLSIEIFRVLDGAGNRISIEEDGARLSRALISVLNGQAASDPLNHLVLSARLDIREIALLLSYRGHLFQLSPSTSLTFITRTLRGNPGCVSLLWEYFRAKFDPGRDRQSDQALKDAEEAFLNSLSAVSSLPEDEILRFIFHLIVATVRTNYFLDKPYLSHKVESSRLERIPEPKPVFEIFVSSPHVEAIHLRGGRIARGGLRWSDRPDDFRTEVLGLMKTQMTKNTLIVPEGSKGGFVLKNPPGDRGLLKAHVKQQYKVFIRGLLDITDNIVEGKAVHPEGLVVYDDLDPYLVVAADKGTATFSDTANEVSNEYHFWLGDAFASGGSHGYDHKKEGITARGAWECVRRHFLEIGVDVFRDEFTVAGIGDMSGDVFGNGLIHTDKARLLAAFNHQHIFLDPSPDAAASFQERVRLFNDPSLNWSNYDSSLISPGGGVFDRHAKVIQLSTEAQKLLGVEEAKLSGREIVSRILQLPVDLLWNGGIGTYVKSSSERNADVGDQSNDNVRIDASQLSARIIGEGGNLGLTQLARIEYALGGGRINTDALDNSGGVDMSDHEVNIKILLQPEVGSGELAFAERNQLLEEMTDEVSELVLKNNSSQSLCLSISQAEGVQGLSRYEALILYLAKEGRLKPNVEFLPGAKPLEVRRRNRQGLTRPELAILLAYTKMGFKRTLLSSTLPDEPGLAHYLPEYFPKVLRSRFQAQIEKHPLRREIIATQLTNHLVDRLGLGFLHGLIEDSGARAEDAMQAAVATYEILALESFFESLLNGNGTVPVQKQYSAIREISLAARGVSLWLLVSGANTQDVSDLVRIYHDALLKLRVNLVEYLPADSERKKFKRKLQKNLDAGFSEEVATHLAAADYLPSCLGVVEISHVTGVPLEEVGPSFYSIGDVFSLGWIRDELSRIEAESQWEAIALTGLIMDLRYVQRELTVEYFGQRSSTGKKIRKFLAGKGNFFQRAHFTVKRLRSQRKVDLASASVVTRQMLQLLSPGSSRVGV